MNRLATRTNQMADRMPTVAAQIDLTNEGQRRLHDLIRRTHSGRWPMFRSLGMRQIAGMLYEAVEWLGQPASTFKVVKWRSDGHGMNWKDAESAAHARTMLNALK